MHCSLNIAGSRTIAYYTENPDCNHALAPFVERLFAQCAFPSVLCPNVTAATSDLLDYSVGLDRTDALLFALWVCLVLGVVAATEASYSKTSPSLYQRFLGRIGFSRQTPTGTI